MNKHLIIGVAIAIAIFALGWLVYRFYKRIGRRCTIKDCGRTVKRKSKILLPPDEVVSCHSSKGKWRWWIRRVIKLTFTKCEKDGVKLVKFDTSPISLWHAYWVKWFHKEQYYLAEPDLIEATRVELRRLYLGGRHENLDPLATDTPLISLDVLFQGFFDEIDEIIGGDND